MSNVNVDNADTTSIEYDSYGPEPWQLIQTANNGAVFDQTLSSVGGTGGAAFRFHGTQVQVFGTLTPPADAGGVVTSSYSVDGSHTASFASTSVSLAALTEQDGQLFYDSGTIADGEHILIINVTAASTGEPYLLDYIKYAATASTSTSVSASASNSASASPSGSTSASNSASASASATAAPDAPSSSHTDIGPIIGGVVGGVVALLLFGVGLFIYLRYFRHRFRLSKNLKGGKDLVEGLIDDDQLENGSDTIPRMRTHTPAHLASEVSASSTWLSNTTLTAPASTVGPDDSASQVAGRIYAAELAQQHPPVPEVPEPEGEPETIQHEDSGIRFREGDIPPAVLGEDEILEEMPPEYTPAS
ncbi:hypothetical protein C2E23DRAFT_834137 [Lenzites betulinus]|nr:hypothetical protein C2E23DRAFT_834137 [Lenzites betulinus]